MFCSAVREAGQGGETGDGGWREENTVEQLVVSPSLLFLLREKWGRLVTGDCTGLPVS